MERRFMTDPTDSIRPLYGPHVEKLLAESADLRAMLPQWVGMLARQLHSGQRTATNRFKVTFVDGDEVKVYMTVSRAEPGEAWALEVRAWTVTDLEAWEQEGSRLADSRRLLTDLIDHLAQHHEGN
jgi:hypothetical protein